LINIQGKSVGFVLRDHLKYYTKMILGTMDAGKYLKNFYYLVSE
jgi:hypothetical protein